MRERGRISEGASRARERRELLLLALIAAAASVWLVWGWSWAVSLNDYATEAKPSFTALLHGHILTFLQTAPPYGASLLLRAPFALPGSLAGGGPLLIYRLSALPCLLALDAVGLWLARDLRRAGGSLLAAAATVAICAVNPITYRALQLGHPEDLLGAALCVAAVLLAARGRLGWSAIALGLAVANKDWALLAAGPVFIAAPRRRLRTLSIAGGVALALMAPLALASGSVTSASNRLVVATSGNIFHLQQVFWFLGRHGDWQPKLGIFIPRGFTLAPTWLSPNIHVIIVAVGVPLTLLAWRRRTHPSTALLLLAMLMLLRCYLDPWDTVYYPVPFIVALLAWETTVARRVPLLAVVATAATWWLFWYMPSRVNPNLTALSFLVVTTVALLALAAATFGLLPSRAPSRRAAPALSRAPAVPS